MNGLSLLVRVIDNSWTEWTDVECAFKVSDIEMVIGLSLAWVSCM